MIGDGVEELPEEGVEHGYGVAAPAVPPSAVGAQPATQRGGGERSPVGRDGTSARAARLASTIQSQGPAVCGHGGPQRLPQRRQERGSARKGAMPAHNDRLDR